MLGVTGAPTRWHGMGAAMAEGWLSSGEDSKANEDVSVGQRMRCFAPEWCFFVLQS